MIEYGMEYTYNLNNQVITELDPVNKQKGLLFTIKYAYDALGRVKTQTDAKGHIASYEYDDTGNLLYARMQKDASSPKQVTEHNQYDFIGRLTAKTDGNGNTATFISARECKNASEGIYTKPSRNRT
jgi:YD repeat-containing protein